MNSVRTGNIFFIFLIICILCMIDFKKTNQVINLEINLTFYLLTKFVLNVLI